MPPLPAPGLPERPDDAPPPWAHEAARGAGLASARRLVYLGGDGRPLAAFCEAWPALEGEWLGPHALQAGAQGFLARHGLARRVRFTPGARVDALPPADLLLCCALDFAVDETLQRLATARADWLGPRGRCAVLKRPSPHLSCVVGEPLLQSLGLRRDRRRELPGGVVLLVAVPGQAPDVGAGRPDAGNDAGASRGRAA